MTPTSGQGLKDRRLHDLLNNALIARIDGDERKVAENLLTAIEVAYNLGELPSDLTALVDDIASVRNRATAA